MCAFRSLVSASDLQKSQRRIVNLGEWSEKTTFRIHGAESISDDVKALDNGVFGDLHRLLSTKTHACLHPAHGIGTVLLCLVELV